MAFVKIRVPRTSQPQDACGLDASYGVSAAWSATNAKFELLTGDDAVWDQMSGSIVPTQRGLAFKNVGYFSHVSVPAERPAGRFLLVTAFTNATSIASEIIASTKDYWNQPDGFFVGSKNDENTLEISGGGGGFPQITMPGLGAAGAYHCLVVEFDGATATGYLDGVRMGAVAITPVNPFKDNRMGIGTYSNNANADSRRLYHLSALATQGDPISLSANPWQLFEPEELTIWIPDAVGASGTATVIPIGVQAGGAIGTPTAIGAAIAALTGVSATGLVGTPAATGGASIPATASPSGVSASSAVGSPIAKGAAKALPTGVAATTNTGSPVAKGAAKALPTGVQVISAVGVPLANGGSSIPATVLPAGVAGLAYVGAPAATGQARAYPLGVQATGAVGSPIVTAGGSAVAQPLGVAASSSVGAPVARGAAVAYPLGLAGYWSVGQPVAIGQSAMPATAYPAGVSATGYVGAPVAFEASDATPSIYIAISPAQSHQAISPAQSYTATSPAQSYTAVVPAQIYST